ncbi:MAG: hypothetical protein WAX69_08595 [Victivallales bacterium]
MSFKYLLISAFLLFISVSSYAGEPMVTLSITEQDGRLTVESDSKNGLVLGQISSEEKKSSVIRIKNLTSSTIKLGGWRSPCECLDLEEPLWEMSSKAESISKAVLDGSSYRGRFEKNMHISFSSDDTERVNFFLPVKFAVSDGVNPDATSNILHDESTIGIRDGKITAVVQMEMGAKEFNPNDKGTVYVFAGRTCPGCNHMRNVLGPKLLEKYGLHGGRVALLDLEKSENMLVLANLEEKLGTRGTKTPVVYFNGIMMYGKAGIEEEINQAGTNASAGHISLDNAGSSKAVERKAEGITVGVIAMAGLVDGINPCVFAGLVFLSSLLASSRMGGKRLLVLGGAYCLGSFVCYFLMGLGLLGIINSLVGGGGLPRIMLNWGMALVLCIFSYLSFRDAIAFKNKGTGSAMKLKLPDSLQLKIRKLMHNRIGGKTLWAGAFGAGAVVTVIESACTGQIYVPVLAFLAKMEGVFSKWIVYLLLYNVMFVVPLVGLLLAVHFGISSLKLASLTRIDAFAGKILMGLLFACLAVLMILL